MDDKADYIKLVKKAQLGDEECLNRLAELARERLRVYVYRLVLQDDMTQDIVQESMLEMFKILGKLKRADRFWPWLYGIALNKMHRHHRAEQRRRTVSVSETGYGGAQKNKQEGLENLVSQELKQIVSMAMAGLKPRHRSVLAMRCYDEMAYSEIAESMGCSEFAARMLFHRAKRALQKQLSRSGLGKGSLLAALVLFGKMTAPSEAAAAGVSVTAVSTKVGVAAALVAMAGGKTAVVSLTTAGVLAVGTMVATSGRDKTMAVPGEKPVRIPQVTEQVNQASKGIEECWYYFPESASGPVMMRVMKSDSKGKQSYCAWRQNEQGNYYFDRRKNTIYINNYRMWRSDLAVRRLPTDKANLIEFLSQVEDRTEEMEYVAGQGDGLLVIARPGGNESSNRSRIIRHYNILDEEYFRYDWPAGIKMVDNRDAMHKRGWTYFTVDGEIDGEEVSGAGRMPFVYAASEEYSPWLRLKVGNRMKIVDGGAEALVYDGRGKVAASYRGGSFFKGLGRPWMGLHTIDTVRRDAAEQQVRFEIKYKPKDKKAQVVLTCGQGKLVYTIDMEKDVIDEIKISASDGREGELRFSYLQDIDEIGGEFVQPRIRRSYGTKRRESPGMLWLLRIGEW